MLGCGLVALGTSSFALGMSVALWVGHLWIRRRGGGKLCEVGVSVVSRCMCRVTTGGSRDE